MANLIGWTEQQAVDKLRRFLGDQIEKNRLIEGRELHDDDLKLAFELTLDEINSAEPETNFTFDTLPKRKNMLLCGAAIKALTMAGLVQARNYLTFSDGGISESISDKSQVYQQWANQLAISYKQEVSDMKTVLNMKQAFGQIHSPYHNLADDEDGWTC